jgi:hypothetical protein
MAGLICMLPTMQDQITCTTTNTTKPSKSWEMLSGVALSGDGLEQGSMGVDWGDYLHEGRLSMLVTNFTEQPDTLYRNLGKVSDVNACKIDAADVALRGLGTAFFDVDNDGWLDILVAMAMFIRRLIRFPRALPTVSRFSCSTQI